MVQKGFYCPKCGELWDQIECDNCGYMEKEVRRPKHKVKDREDDDRRGEHRA